MPIVPNLLNPPGTKSPITEQQPSETNLMMAAADMHRMGRLVEQPEPNVSVGRRPRLKAVRKR